MGNSRVWWRRRGRKAINGVGTATRYKCTYPGPLVTVCMSSKSVATAVVSLPILYVMIAWYSGILTRKYGGNIWICASLEKVIVLLRSISSIPRNCGQPQLMRIDQTRRGRDRHWPNPALNHSRIRKTSPDQPTRPSNVPWTCTITIFPSNTFKYPFKSSQVAPNNPFLYPVVQH